MPNKPKKNYNAETAPTRDFCQTPPYALDPLLPYIRDFHWIWEPAAGEGLMYKALVKETAATVKKSDVLTGTDFLTQNLIGGCMITKAIVTNPPFSLKYEWLARCYELGYPFALLMPADMLFAAKGNKLFQKYGIEIIIMNPRVDFKMPHKKWKGKGAQMATAWFTWGLGVGKILSFADISESKKRFKETLRNK